MNDDLDTDYGNLSDAEAHQARLRQATRQAALFPTRQALARWRGGGELPHLHEGAPPLRAAWYARIAREYQSWLDRGGFAQHEDGLPLSPMLALPAPAPAGAPAPQPARDCCTSDCTNGNDGLSRRSTPEGESQL